MAASTQDFVQGFDPTGLTSITGAQLLTLLTSGTPYDDKGLVVTTDDIAGLPEVPNAALITKWQRYMWRRVGASSVSIYVWNPNAATDATYLKWVGINTVGIAAGSIVNSMIADNTITDSKIANITWEKITNPPTIMSLSDAATGDLTGSTWGNATIAASAITTSKIAAGAVTTSKIANDGVETVNIKDQNVTTAKIVDDGVTTLKILNANVTAAKLEAAILAAAAIPVTAPAAGDYVFLGDASAGTAYANIKATIANVVAAALAGSLFNSGEIAVPASGAVTADIPHGLGAVPSLVRAVLVCKSAEFGFAVGDEVPLESFGFGGADDAPAFVCKVDATNFKVVRSSVDANVGILRFNATIGNAADITPGNWRIKIYARL